MRNWIASDFFPEESRIVLRATSVEAEDRALLLGVREFISAVEWQASEIQNGLPDVAKALDLPVRDAFRVTYQSLLGKSRGPRVGTLLAAFDRETVLDTLDSALD
jgi:lysyl-tRNA synthetase class I